MVCLIYLVDPIKDANKALAGHIFHFDDFGIIFVGEELQEELTVFGQQELVSFMLRLVIQFYYDVSQFSRIH